MSLVDEKRRLHRADEFILMAKERIERQGEIIADLARRGQETAEAVNLLETLHMTLDAMTGYRTLVAELSAPTSEASCPSLECSHTQAGHGRRDAAGLSERCLLTARYELHVVRLLIALCKHADALNQASTH